jgi:hypothetical protein
MGFLMLFESKQTHPFPEVVCFQSFPNGQNASHENFVKKRFSIGANCDISIIDGNTISTLRKRNVFRGETAPSSRPAAYRQNPDKKGA